MNNDTITTNQNDIKTLIYIYFLSVFLFYLYDLSQNKKIKHEIQEYLIHSYEKTKTIIEEKSPLFCASVLEVLSKLNISITNDTISETNTETTSISSKEENEKE